ncbi:MAG: hypothetical protein ABIO70_34305 [Pseudomonadota bacterium]
MSPPRARWTLLVILGAALCYTWPLALHPLDLLGHPLGETDNHAWMFWRALRQLQGAGPLASWPDGLPLPLMDPVNLPLAALAGTLHPALSYNLVLLGNVSLLLGATWWLARQHVGPRAGWVAMVAVACSPFLSGELEFGITESLPLWALAAHLAFLERLARGGGRHDALGAGLCLGAFALSGWYNAFFGAVAEVVLLAWYGLRSRRWGWLAAQAALGAFLPLPALVQFLGMRSFWQGRWHVPDSVPRAHLDHWRWLRNYGTDALNLVLPSLEPAPISHSVYLGLGVLALAALGVWGGRRRALPWLVLALVFVALALGHWLRVGGAPLTIAGQPIPGPARLLVRALPPLAGLSHWHRAVGPATVFLGLLAALGAERLVARRTGLALGLCGLLLAESVLLGQTRWPRVHYPLDAPPIYAALEAPGALLELPFDNGRLPFSQDPPRLYNRWQMVHGRPVAESYEGPDAILAVNRLAAAADALCGVAPTRPPFELPPPAMRDPAPLADPEVLAVEAAALRDVGFAYVVLHRERAQTPARAEALLTRAFGSPEVDLGPWVAWAVEGTAQDPGSDASSYEK